MMKKCVHHVPEHPSTLSPAQTGPERGEDDCDQAITQQPYRFEARPAVLPWICRSNDSSFEFKSLSNVGEVKPMVDEVSLPLRLVPDDLHLRPIP
jgi:hypothetical protein